MSSTFFPASADSASASKPLECKQSPSANAKNTANEFSPSIGPESQSMTMSEPYGGGHTREQLTLFAADTHASHLAQPAAEAAMKMKGISGRRCLELYATAGRDGSLPKMLLDILASVSTRLPHRWKLKASPSGRLLFQLAPLTHSTAEIACGLWPTPTVGGGGQTLPEGTTPTGKTPEGRKQTVCLERYAMNVNKGLWPTPDIRGFTNKGALQMLAKKASSREEWAQMSYRTSNGVRETLWPTPTRSMNKGSSLGAMTRVTGKSRLNDRLDYATEQGITSAGRLNPQWVEWLMGYPIEWTALKPSVTRSSRKSRRSSAKQL